MLAEISPTGRNDVRLAQLSCHIPTIPLILITPTTQQCVSALVVYCLWHHTNCQLVAGDSADIYEAP